MDVLHQNNCFRFENTKSSKKTRMMQGEMKVWKERTSPNYKWIKENCYGTGLPMLCVLSIYIKWSSDVRQ